MHFLNLYRTGSFSKAAEKLYITQPALSMAVAKAEASIGMPLFDRSTRPVTLTPAGKIYIDTVIKARNLEQDLHQQFEDIRDLKRGKVVIGATHYINSYILAPILAEFGEEFPGIRLEVEEGAAIDMLQMLKDRNIRNIIPYSSPATSEIKHVMKFRRKCITRSDGSIGSTAMLSRS